MECADCRASPDMKPNSRSHPIPYHVIFLSQGCTANIVTRNQATWTQLGWRVRWRKKILTMQTLRGNLSLTDSVWLRWLFTFALVTMRLEWPLNCFGVAPPRILCHPGGRGRGTLAGGDGRGRAGAGGRPPPPLRRGRGRAPCAPASKKPRNEYPVCGRSSWRPAPTQKHLNGIMTCYQRKLNDNKRKACTETGVW